MIRLSSAAILVCMVCSTMPVLADDPAVVFAVVSEIPKDKTKVSVKAVADGSVMDLKLIPTEVVQENMIWKKLEVCHAVKVEGTRMADGFKVVTVFVLDASMLPMALQGFAGDCLIKKAVEVAPFVD